MCTAKISPV